MSEKIKTEIKAYLEEGGSATRATLADVTDADDTGVTRSLGKLVSRGEIDEHPEIDGAFRLVKPY
jgi:hypothetical protein